MVGLVVLLMLTLLGVSSMNMTTLELRIAGNTQNRNIAFQVADSVNDFLFTGGADQDGDTFLYTSTADQNFATTTVIANPPGSSNAQTISTLSTGTYEGVGPAILCPGNSFTLSCNSFQLSSQASSATTNASSTIVQGFVKPGPSLEN